MREIEKEGNLVEIQREVRVIIQFSETTAEEGDIWYSTQYPDDYKEVLYGTGYHNLKISTIMEIVEKNIKTVLEFGNIFEPGEKLELLGLGLSSANESVDIQLEVKLIEKNYTLNTSGYPSITYDVLLNEVDERSWEIMADELLRLRCGYHENT